MPGGEQNTFGLPDGEAIRVEMAAIFREQRLALLGWMDSEGYKAFGLPMSWPSWESLRLGAAEIAGRVKGAIADIWESAGKSWLTGHGKDPARFDVSVPPLSTQIDAQANGIGREVNAGTTDRLNGLLTRVTDQFNRNEKTLAESIEALRKGIVEEVRPMEAWRARRIAVTEAARGYHSALNAAAIASGFVTGWQWLLADGACPFCEMIAEQCQFVPLGQAFAVVGDGPYSEIYYPPAHPNCRCDIVEIVLTDEQPDWGETLVNPVIPKASQLVGASA